MRVIAGEARGCPLKAPKGMITRPTQDRVREAVFNILGARVPGSRCLDLFAGTGAIGIEALSRGAKKVTFVENHRTARKTIRENLERTGLAGGAEVLATDVFAALGRMNMEARYDLVFADPPYGHGLSERTLQVVTEQGVLERDGWLIVETGAKEQIRDQVNGLKQLRTNVYGDTAIHIFGHQQ